jgi:hypothetical protein
LAAAASLLARAADSDLAFLAGGWTGAGGALRFGGGGGGFTTGTFGGLGHFLGFGFLTAEVLDPRDGFDGRNILFFYS